MHIVVKLYSPMCSLNKALNIISKFNIKFGQHNVTISKYLLLHILNLDVYIYIYIYINTGELDNQ
jgi:hypothetical protein